MNNRAQKILGLLYVPDAIYLKEMVVYSEEEGSAIGKFVVPRAHSYTHHPITYVTAEQYVRCLSQLSCVLVSCLVQDKAMVLDFVDYESFTQLMVESKLWFRRSDLRYLKNTMKGAGFELSLTLKEVGTRRSSWFCVLQIGGVISGELEFVAPHTNKG